MSNANQTQQSGDSFMQQMTFVNRKPRTWLVLLATMLVLSLGNQMIVTADDTRPSAYEGQGTTITEQEPQQSFDDASTTEDTDAATDDVNAPQNFGLNQVTVATPAELTSAIDTANANCDTLRTTIHLDTAGSFVFTSAAYDNGNSAMLIKCPLTIDGHGQTIERSTAPGTPEFRLMKFDVASDGTAPDFTMSDVTLKNGLVPSSSTDDAGAAIYNPVSPMILTNVTFDKNEASFGGALFVAQHPVQIVNSTFTSNLASNLGGGYPR